MRFLRSARLVVMGFLGLSAAGSVALAGAAIDPDLAGVPPPVKQTIPDLAAVETAEPRDHWAFQPPLRSALPRPRRQDWARNPIDCFVLARLEAAGLSPAPEADRATLIRRLFFTVLGLPPSPDELDQFVADQRDCAYEVLVDRVLSSPRYGERWARHWLDVVRFAESHGFETNTERPNAWPYRDYVIGVFNQDRSYAEFILEQMAGDALGADAATGFLVGGPFDAVKSPDLNLTQQQRMDELHDMISTTGTAFLGLTIGCARCHDHKFDPIAQTDYYAMQAIFAGVQHGERPIHPPDYGARLKAAEAERECLAAIQSELVAFAPVADPGRVEKTPGANLSPASGELTVPVSTRLRPPVHPRQNIDRFTPIEGRFLRFTIQETTGGEPAIDELEVFTPGQLARNVALAEFGTKAMASGTYAGDEQHKLEHVNDGRLGNSRSWISNEPGRGWVQLEFPEPVRMDRVFWSRDREGRFSDRLITKYTIEIAMVPGQWTQVASWRDRERFTPGMEPKFLAADTGLSRPEMERFEGLLKQKRAHEDRSKQLTSFPTVYGGRFEQPGPTHRLYRGESLQKREQVAPGAVRGLGRELRLPADAPEQERRLSLARWMIDPANPLTARVLVNRLWHYHFGQGIVRTPSDFGAMGAKPTHPELLDWLATEFTANGWSIKRMQRLILLSATFRQSSAVRSDALKADANSELLWRFPPRRLEAEPLRDTILAVSSALDLRMGGRGFDLFEPNDNYVKVYNPKATFGPAEWRRMIYQSKPRMRLDDTFGAFDCPDAGQVTPRRSVSTTPLQALNLLNSPFLLEQTALFAHRLRTEAGPLPAAEVERAFRLAFNRRPTSAENEAAVRLIDERGLSALCRSLLNANEFVHVY